MVDWDSWQKHVKQVVADDGMWIGLADENWEPIMDVPPVHELSAKALRLSAADLELSAIVRKGDAVSPMVDHLIADGLGKFDERGVLEISNQPARNIIVQRAGERSRQAYFITDTIAVGDEDAPYLLKPQAQDLLGLLSATPCPSIPRTWGVNGMQTWAEDAGGKYGAPRVYGAVEFADSLDGFTVDGEAVSVIRDLVQDSIDALVKQMGWSRPHIVVDYAGTVGTKRTVIRLTDQSIWEAIAEPARLAGVNVSCDLWWPGDAAVLARPARGLAPKLTTWQHPICVVRVETIRGV